MNKTRPSFAACASTLLAVRIALRTMGFRRTLRVLHARSLATPRMGMSTESIIDDTVRHLAAAAAFFPGRALCLEQSLTLYYCLRRQGIFVDLRLGVRHTPFTAHAWVEYDGAPLYEQRDTLHQVMPVSGSLL